MSLNQDQYWSFIKKSSYEKNGISDLKKEYNGFRWYLNNSGHKFRVEKYEIEGIYYELKIENLMPGSPIQKPLNQNNLMYYEAAVIHYLDVWTETNVTNGMYPVHGDFSLDGNIFFVNNKVAVIDWEHFSEFAAPLGFDILYLVFEAIKIHSRTKLPKVELMEMARNLIDKAFMMSAIDTYYCGNTFDIFINEQTKLLPIWNNQLDKVPTFNFTEKQLQFMRPYFQFSN